MKSTIEGVERELIKILKEKSGLIKVADILSELDISSISQNIEHKHPNFPKDSLLKLYLFKRVKGICNYPELTKSLDGEAIKLGLKELPAKRSFNEFIQKKVDRPLLDTIAETILRVATQNKVILDIELVKKTIEKKRKEINRYQRELREAVKLVKRLVYPQIDLKIHHNAKFTTKDLLDVLVHVAQNNDFCNNGSMTFKELNPDKKVPHGDTIMHHFNKFKSTEEIKTIFERIFDVILNFAKKEHDVLRKRKVDIAFDVHKMPYYGSKDDDYVCGGKHERGTTKFFEFLTCCIVVAGRRFTIDAVPVHPFDTLEKLIDDTLRRVKSKIHIDKVYLDRGFDRPKIINVLKRNNVKFLMPKVRSHTVKAWYDKAEGCKARVVKDFVMGTGENKAIANLVLVDDEEGIKRAFITNLDVSEPMAHYLFKLYGRRWGIETGYRNMDKDFKPRTTSKNYNIRLFYFLFSVCLYNLWVLVNICISIAIHGKVLDKPIITAKMFCICLYRVYIDSGG